MHGAQDTTVPLADAQTLIAQRGAANARLLTLDGTHEAFADPAAAESAVLGFLAGQMAG